MFDSVMNCLECGGSVAGNVEAYHQRGFCSDGCQDAWDIWRLQEKARNLPGLQELYDGGGEVSAEQLLLFIDLMLGCVVTETSFTTEGWTLEVMFLWGFADHNFFIGEWAHAFSDIDGFWLDKKEWLHDDDPENMGLRRVMIQTQGRDLKLLCLRVIDVKTAVVARFNRECEKWAQEHLAELEKAATSYCDSDAAVKEVEGEGIFDCYVEFMEWLERFPECSEKRRA